MLPLGGVVGLHRFGLDDDGSVASLIVLALVRNRPRHVTTRRQHHTGHNDCHK